MGNGNDQSIYTDEECVLLERFANTPNPETGRYPSDEACDRYAERLRRRWSGGFATEQAHAQGSGTRLPVRSVRRSR
jgi:hypothetical protein